MRELEITKIICLCLISASIFILCYGYYSKAMRVANEDHDYQLVQLGEMRRDQYLIDKKTGRNWVSICVGDAKGPDCDGDIMWQERLVVGLNGYTEENFYKYLEYLKSTENQKSKKD